MITVDGIILSFSGWSESWRWRRRLRSFLYVFRDRCRVMTRLLVGICGGDLSPEGSAKMFR